jgi:hypothetical protein
VKTVSKEDTIPGTVRNIWKRQYKPFSPKKEIEEEKDIKEEKFATNLPGNFKGMGENQTMTEEWEEKGFEREREMREVLNALAHELLVLKKDKEKGGEAAMRKVINEYYEKMKVVNHFGLETWYQ